MNNGNNILKWNKEQKSLIIFILSTIELLLWKEVIFTLHDFF